MRLKTLRLKKSDSKIPAEILYEDFTHLEIFGGALEALPAELFCQEKLQVLKIKNAGLAQLPQQLPRKANSKLHTLVLQQNQLTGLPPWVQELTGLDTLDVGNNSLSSLPIVLPQNLKRLNLESNTLGQLPEALYQLKHLLHLSVDHNPLDEATQARLYETFGIWVAAHS